MRTLPSGYYPNGFIHADKRFGGDEIIHALPIIGQIKGVKRKNVLVTYGNNGTKAGVLIEPISQSQYILADSQILPRYEVEINVNEPPLCVYLPDLICHFIDFTQHPQEEGLVEVVKAFGWQAGLVALGCLPLYNNIERCYRILQNMAKVSDYQEELSYSPRNSSSSDIPWWNDPRLPFSSDVSEIISRRWNTFIKKKDNDGYSFMDKDQFEIIREIIHLTRDGDLWYQLYEYESLQRRPVFVRGNVHLILRSVAEEILLHENNLNHGLNRIAKGDPAIRQISPNPVTFFIDSDCVYFDTSPAIADDLSRFYKYPPRKLDPREL